MINRDRVRRRRRINREINREEDYLCWSRGNKAIIALWGSCKKLHYTAAAISSTYCSYTYCSYMCSATCAAAAICVWQPWTFGLSEELKCQLLLPPPLSDSSFPNVYICIWSSINFAKPSLRTKDAISLVGCFDSCRGNIFSDLPTAVHFSPDLTEGEEWSVFKYNLKFSTLKNCI